MQASLALTAFQLMAHATPDNSNVWLAPLAPEARFKAEANPDANIAFHQALIPLSGSKVLIEMAGTDHLAIIGTLQQRNAAHAKALTRDHTPCLASSVEAYGDGIFIRTPPALRATGHKGNMT